ncbi:GDP-L-fucose synthase [Stenotrophomonas sp. GD03993]|uniref:GDP-L-fucose synthase n=2 Tax=Stenotrophomonas TaxID=40323 RepID=UPI0018D318D2|nr:MULTISPECIES: GDP-L-fucose synthase [Stenotrophomonas]MBH1461105.1 GDP-L-fucose synthase [Stenotrophomonas maltophilia]MDH0464517.1 GDP-L-fucose synthase [Stenotrophomonas sp. GD03993]MDH0877023.1 GDP-L-fucose synthase [Stenotrophomonas sp. GD03877]MDH2156543.1 GDP-L-fucose synthase [Stenotrophomonas sp. GD03657]
MTPESRIFVAGHRGLVGSAIVRRLTSLGYRNLILASRDVLDLRDRQSVDAFFERERPEIVFLAAAKVGGIHANSTYPADFLFENLQIQNNVIDGAYRFGVEKLAFLGSSCIYPKHAEQPIREESLLTGSLEATNEWYAVAKIAGIKMCQAYRRQYGFNAISLMPTNLYGPGDNFDLQNSHVLPALIRKFHDAKIAGIPEVVMWGSGTPRREFLHVDDMAAASVFLAETYSGEDIVNVGVGEDISILELAELVRAVTGFSGRIVNDLTKPDGTPRKLLDVSRLSDLGWKAKIGLREGVAATYEWFLENQGSLREV